MTGTSRVVFAALFCLVLIAIPLAGAAECADGCTCMLQSDATENGYSPCGGMLTACGYDSYGSAKYCYAKARTTQRPAGTAFAGSDCPPVSGLAITGGTTLAQAGIAGRDGIHCQYSLPGTCREQPCTAILRVERTGSPGAAGSLMNTISPPGTIAGIKRIYTMVDSGQTADHRYVIFKNNPGNSAPAATSFAGALVYRDVYVIQAESGQGYWVASDSTARSALTNLENAGKSVVDRKTGAAVPGLSSQPVRSPANSPFPGGSPAPAVLPDVTGPGITPDEILQNFLRGLGALGNGFNLLSPLDVDWDEVPGAMYSGMTPALLGALGALLGGSIGGFYLAGPGISWPDRDGGEGGDGESELMCRGVTWDDDKPAGGSSGEGRTASDVVAAGIDGPTDLEQLATDIGNDVVDRLGESPLPESPGVDQTASDPEEVMNIVQTAGDDFIRELENDPEVVQYKQDLVNDLTAEMKEVVRKMTADGLRVQNPFLTQKDGWVDSALYSVRDAGLFGELAVGMERGFSWVGNKVSVTDYRKYGKCTEFTENWGIPYSTEGIRKVFGEDTYIGQTVINEDIPDKNHTAVQIIAPAGDRYVVDFWESMQKTNQDPVNNPAKEIKLEVRTEDKWVQYYREQFKTPGGKITYDNDQEAVRKYFRDTLPAPGSTQDPVAGFNKAATGFIKKPGDFYLQPGTEKSLMNGLDKIRRDGGSI